ncbi:hypothetical protein RchiOBHm_Chr3g0476981 [Rosa chinensis]|uniref:Uncharacterized protein n=1 Tax=Rosa chinensis TaxID=74649 RepID=A0A2P6RCS6_ROSCH|nr:hypothetical protein RchiOBHm_Chr3g0476981 [Rosa chinensis]
MRLDRHLFSALEVLVARGKLLIILGDQLTPLFLLLLVFLDLLSLQSLGNMLLFQYLVNALEGDFQPHNCIYAETANWVLLRVFAQHAFGIKKDKLQKLDEGLIMELDLSKKTAEMQGSTTTADGVRTPLLEIVLDELTYDEDILDSFLQDFNEPKWKLEIVVQYLWKYNGKMSFQSYRKPVMCPNHPIKLLLLVLSWHPLSMIKFPTDDASFNGALKCFSNVNSTKTTIKKIRPELAQLLLAHGLQNIQMDFTMRLAMLSRSVASVVLQPSSDIDKIFSVFNLAHLSLPCKQHVEGTSASSEETSNRALIEVSENIISAFRNLKTADKKMEILPLGKEALFMAATIISAQS